MARSLAGIIVPIYQITGRVELHAFAERGAVDTLAVFPYQSFLSVISCLGGPKT